MTFPTSLVISTQLFNALVTAGYLTTLKYEDVDDVFLDHLNPPQEKVIIHNYQRYVSRHCVWHMSALMNSHGVPSWFSTRDDPYCVRTPQKRIRDAD